MSLKLSSSWLNRDRPGDRPQKSRIVQQGTPEDNRIISSENRLIKITHDIIQSFLNISDIFMRDVNKNYKSSDYQKYLYENL